MTIRNKKVDRSESRRIISAFVKHGYQPLLEYMGINKRNIRVMRFDDDIPAHWERAFIDACDVTGIPFSHSAFGFSSVDKNELARLADEANQKRLATIRGASKKTLYKMMSEISGPTKDRLPFDGELAAISERASKLGIFSDFPPPPNSAKNLGKLSGKNPEVEGLDLPRKFKTDWRDVDCAIRRYIEDGGVQYDESNIRSANHITIDGIGVFASRRSAADVLGVGAHKLTGWVRVEDARKAASNTDALGG